MERVLQTGIPKLANPVPIERPYIEVRISWPLTSSDTGTSLSLSIPTCMNLSSLRMKLVEFTATLEAWGQMLPDEHPVIALTSKTYQQEGGDKPAK